jgi:hypothetical protein
MRRLFVRHAWLAAAWLAAGTACATGSQRGSTSQPEECSRDCVIEVTNLARSDVDLYMYPAEGGVATYIGTVRRRSRDTWSVPFIRPTNRVYGRAITGARVSCSARTNVAERTIRVECRA